VSDQAPKGARVKEGRKVVITGGRDFMDYEFVRSTLDALDPRPTLIASGCATGADRLAMTWAKKMGVQFVGFPVYQSQWRVTGKGAGPIRNGLMLDILKPDLVVAFPGNRGTADCIRQAERRGITVQLVNPEVTP
jgi:predicted Rossmann-fold nucleotide-binding protein